MELNDSAVGLDLDPLDDRSDLGLHFAPGESYPRNDASHAAGMRLMAALDRSPFKVGLLA
jgi:hypothetical protein